MKRSSRLSLLGLGVLVAIFMFAGRAMAESDDGTTAALFSGVILLFVLIFGAAIYVYMALALQTIATNGDRKCMVCLDSDCQSDFDVDHRQETDLVACAFSHSACGIGHRNYCVDGNCRSSRQTELVGHPDAGSSSEFYCSWLPRLGGLK